MSLPISTSPCAPSLTQALGTGQVVVKRHLANYHRSIWGDYFLRYASLSDSKGSDDMATRQIEKLTRVVKKMLLADDEAPQKLHLIDQIQRLGIARHFETEIDDQLDRIHKSYLPHVYNGDYNTPHDLRTTALLFRLLRQQGHKVSSEIFNKLKDYDGKLDKSIILDVQGLLSLYEACHLRIHGEDILDEALAFTTTQLESIVKSQGSPILLRQVRHALNQPLYKGLPRLEARHYIGTYQEDPSHDDTLLTLAKLDFNLLQKQHQKELAHVTRWWKELNFAKNLPFARDRLVELYFWVMGVYYEPEFALARKIMTKVIAMTSIIDDIYDAYGTLEELKPFTSAIERWEVDALNGMPEYMQVCYKALLDVFDEIGKEMAEKGTSYRLYYAKEAMKRQVRGFFVEAEWFHKNHIPTMEEYMSVALVTSGHGLLSTISFVGMGEIVTKYAFEWLFGDSKMVKASATIGRLLNDIVSNKFEQERGHVASAVECFVKHHGVGEQEAKKELMKHVVDAWKDINEECLQPNAVPKQLLIRILNFTRVVDVLYTDKDNYTHAEDKLKDYVTSLLVNPLPM